MTQAAHVHEVNENLIRIGEHLEQNRKILDTIDRNDVFATFRSMESLLGSIQISIVRTNSVVIAIEWIDDDTMCRTPFT